MTWSCQAIDHGMTFFPNGKVGPCCQIAADYLKPIDVIRQRDRFADLKTEFPPLACEKCIKLEHEGLPSYRNFFNSHTTSPEQNIVFLDIRNTNQCNLKCRYCGPHFSNQWAKELGHDQSLMHTDLGDVLDVILTDDLQLIYFTGGEPMMIADHVMILSRLTKAGLSKNIKLIYNTNLTLLKYKDVDFMSLWQQFAKVNLMVSIDAIGKLFDNIRSGASWSVVEQNLDYLKNHNDKVNMSVTCVLTMMNIWALVDFIKYFQSRDLPINFIVLEGPDYLALDVIPDALKSDALAVIDLASELMDDPGIQKARNMITNNQNQVLFQHCLSHILLLDHVRKENLFDLLPFRDLAKQMLTNNHEYR